MKVLHLIPSVHPAYGGPIEALIRSDGAWRRLGHTREIASLDLPGDPWTAACPIRTHPLGCALVRRWKGRVPFLRYGFAPRLVPWLRAHVDRFDAVVVHGLWAYADLAARRVLPRSGVPYFVFTHGMLDPWFKRAYPLKHVAKRLVWPLAEGPLLRAARAVLLTSEDEGSVADPTFGLDRFTTAIAGYGVADPPPASGGQQKAFQRRVPELRGPYLLFLGRLHEKKGCDLLIQAFASLAGRHPDLDLVIAGPDPGGLRPGLAALAADLGIGHCLHWPGMLTGDEKWGALRGCTAFALPSHGENFGMAVAEAMACGRPVLISDRVNIASIIVRSGAGLAAPDTVAGTGDLLGRFLALSGQERNAMGAAARRCYEDAFDIDRVMGRTAGVLAGASGT